MQLADLPSELLLQIFEPLPSATLAAVSTTCTSLVPAATQHLYRHLSLSSYTHNLHAVHTLASDPTLGLLVRSFSLTIDDSDTLSPEYYQSLAAALQTIHNVQSLQLHIGADYSWILNQTPLFARLEDFTSSFPLDHNIVSFLQNAPSLLTLQLGHPSSGSDIAALPSIAIPRLYSYTGPASYLSQIVPARPLKFVHLSGDLTLDDIQSFSLRPSSENRAVGVFGLSDEEMSEVEVMSAITSVPPVQVLDALSKTCPSLVCLRIMSTCAFWQAPDFVSIFLISKDKFFSYLSSQTFYSAVASTLSSFRNLSAFELSGMHWESRPKYSPGSDDGSSCSEKEWISPPVTPRVLETEEAPELDEYHFEEAFMEWAY